MAEENWRQIREIFDDALNREGAERVRFVRSACNGDEALLTEVESLLSSLDSADDFMETPAVANVAELIETTANGWGPGRP